MADAPRAVKYGMPASESHRVVENHFVVIQERALFRELHFQHALRIGPSLRAALDAVGICSAPVPVIPVATPEPEPVEPTARPQRVTRPGLPDGLRERLGLR